MSCWFLMLYCFLVTFIKVSFSSSDLKFHNYMSYCRSLFFYCVEYLVNFNLDTHILQFWKLFSCIILVPSFFLYSLFLEFLSIRYGNFHIYFNFLISLLFSIYFAVLLFSHVWLFVTSWTAAHQASLSFTISHSLFQLISIESVMPSNISSSVVPFSSCPQFFPESGSFLVSQIFASDDQSIGASA